MRSAYIVVGFIETLLDAAEEKAKANEAVRQRYLVERQRFRQQQMTNRARQRAPVPEHVFWPRVSD